MTVSVSIAQAQQVPHGTLSEPLRTKAEATAEWIDRVFGSAEAWRRSRKGLTGIRSLAFGKPRKSAIAVGLLPAVKREWALPCADKPIPGDIRATVRFAVTGKGPRPRLEFVLNGKARIAIGRRGESADSLRLELARTYGLLPMVEVTQISDALAEYAASGGSYRPFAKALGMRHADFLAKASNPEEVERAVVMSDRQLERVWRLRPVYEFDGDGDPGEWAETPGEVVIGDPGGEEEAPAPLPMAISKADGRGMESKYFGFALDYGGGHRWKETDFAPPLQIALGGLLNRSLGFGDSEQVDETVPYRGDGFHWGRNNPMAQRVSLGHEYAGPVCRQLLHPEPEGLWYDWLGQAFKVPETMKWEAWQKRASMYERERKKSRIGKQSPPATIPYMSGEAPMAGPEENADRLVEARAA